MQEGYRFNYGKRSAEAEAEPEADADAWYGPYRNNWGNNWPMMSGNNWNMMSYNNWNMNMMNRPGMQVTANLQIFIDTVEVGSSPVNQTCSGGIQVQLRQEVC